MHKHMKTIVISQPLFLPWRGFFELRKLPDIFVYYDDVQYPQGKHLMSRVKIKNLKDFSWLTVPIKRHSDTLIKDVLIDNSQEWRKKHLSLFKESYGRAPYFDDSFVLLERLYQEEFDHLCELTIKSTEEISNYLGFGGSYLRTSNFNIKKVENKSEHVINMIKFFGADTILSAWGALRFYDFTLFEKNNIRVEFVKYSNDPYPQIHGGFDPYVSVIDLIANCGKECAQYIRVGTEYWESFIKTHEAVEYLKKGGKS